MTVATTLPSIEISLVPELLVIRVMKATVEPVKVSEALVAVVEAKCTDPPLSEGEPVVRQVPAYLTCADSLSTVVEPAGASIVAVVVTGTAVAVGVGVEAGAVAVAGDLVRNASTMLLVPVDRESFWPVRLTLMVWVPLERFVVLNRLCWYFVVAE